MTARPALVSPGGYTVPAVSLVLAAVFVCAGAEKMRDMLQFADNIAAFRILPAALINLLALALPPYEIACGVLLLWPTTRRLGALAIALLSMMFFAALSSALLRGLTLDCGCFGSSAPSRPMMWLELAFNVVFILGVLFVYLRQWRLVQQGRPA